MSSSSVLDSVAEFFGTPGGRLIISAGGAIGTWFGLGARTLWKEYKERKKTAKDAADKATAEEEAEEAEDRDWEVRCARTELDLERMDEAMARLQLEANSNLLPLMLEAIALLNSTSLQGDAAVRAQVMAGKLQYCHNRLSVELRAYQKQRPGYLQRKSGSLSLVSGVTSGETSTVVFSRPERGRGESIEPGKAPEES